MNEKKTDFENVEKMKGEPKVKKDKKIINIIENNKDSLKFECLLCKEIEPHLLVIMGKNGDIHVHGPFENRYLMNQFIEAIIFEQKKFQQFKKV